ncbi:MAG: histidine kinase [Burkholderia sp.]|nr:histidine kinase [Burkholderia sp.]
MARKTDTGNERPDAVTHRAASVEHAASRINMVQLIQLRWFAVIGQISTIAFVNAGLRIPLPTAQLLMVLACLIAFNLGSQLRWQEGSPVSNRELFFALLVDVASLTALLYCSGGATNPFAFLYLLQVILSALLLEVWSTWIIVALTSACLAGLSMWSEPLTLPPDNDLGFFSLYVQGMIICFILNASLLVVFITRINANLRAADALLSDLRQRAAEEEHIVRMGLLASGAAHELGTPLATLSVILGDWRRMPEFRRKPELLEEITEMETQLQRCKAIVSGILLSSGEARGESSVRTTIRTFLDQLAQEWRASRPVHDFDYQNRLVQDLPVVFDSTLKQMIFNVLDNALEASPGWVAMEAAREGDALVLSVSDAGPGFTPAMLTHFGKPYHSTKDKPGHGLGLFLVVNVSRTLGGTVSASNRAEGGALVRLTLPLAAIMLIEGDKDAG